MNVTLEIPDEIGYQLVYRRHCVEPETAATRSDLSFQFLNGAWSALKLFHRLRRHSGFLGALKTVAKLATPRRSMYLVAKDGRIVSTGWCTIGRCSYYQVESNAVVVGPIWSCENARGQGIAT